MPYVDCSICGKSIRRYGKQITKNKTGLFFCSPECRAKYMQEKMEQWEEKALDFAQKAHKGQTCDSGKDYMEDHILPVVALLKQITQDRDIITAGYLHDTIEDTDITYDELVLKFGLCVAELVKEVTNKQIYGVKDYFPNLISKKAIIIKFADRLQNISRMEPWSAKRQQKYLDRSKFWKNKKDVKELEKQ